MSLKPVQSILVTLAIAAILSGCVNNNLGGAGAEGQAIFRKTESWGPCLKGDVCRETTILYESGLLIRSGQENATYMLSKEVVAAFVSEIRGTGIMGMDCASARVEDYSAEYSIALDGLRKEISFPGCFNELEKIEAHLPPETPKRGGA